MKDREAHLLALLNVCGFFEAKRTDVRLILDQLGIEALEALIVEAATLSPILGLEDHWWTCYWCDGEGDYQFDRAVHTDDCLWLRLKAAADPLHTHNTPEPPSDPQ